MKKILLVIGVIIIGIGGLFSVASRYLHPVAPITDTADTQTPITTHIPTLSEQYQQIIDQNSQIISLLNSLQFTENQILAGQRK